MPRVRRQNESPRNDGRRLQALAMHVLRRDRHAQDRFGIEGVTRIEGYDPDACHDNLKILESIRNERDSNRAARVIALVGRSLGAVARNFEVYFSDGHVSRFIEGSEVVEKKVFAGKGQHRTENSGSKTGSPKNTEKTLMNGRIQLAKDGFRPYRW